MKIQKRYNLNLKEHSECMIEKVTDQSNVVAASNDSQFLGNGFITTDVLREILKELDDKLSEDDLENMIEEIDADGSGTVDWEGNAILIRAIHAFKFAFYFRIQSCYDRLITSYNLASSRHFNKYSKLPLRTHTALPITFYLLYS